MKVKSAFLIYMENAFIDTKPLNRLTTYRNRCVKYDRIDKWDITEVPLVWLNQENIEMRSDIDNNINESLDMKNKYKFNQINELIFILIKNAFFVQPDEILKEFAFFEPNFYGRGNHNRYYNNADAVAKENETLLLIENSLDYQAKILEFIHNAIDIGFCDVDKIMLIFNIVGLIMSSVSDECKITIGLSKIISYSKNLTRLKPK